MTNPHPTGSDASVTGLRVEDAYDINSTARFTDGNNRSVTALDVVEYGDRFRNAWTPRRGILLDLTSDGDAWVLFRDTKKVEIVKWMNLCKVPSIDEIAPTPKGKPIEDVYPDESGAVVVLPKPDWYSDGFQIKSIPFNHNGFDAVGLYTAGTFVAFLLSAKQQGIAEERERCARVAETEGVTNETNIWNGGADWYKHGRRIAAAIRGAS